MADDESIASTDLQNGIVLVYTPDDMLCEGLKLARVDEEIQALQPRFNMQMFIDRYGSNPNTLTSMWTDIQAPQVAAARVPPKRLNLKYFLMTHHFLKCY